MFCLNFYNFIAFLIQIMQYIIFVGIWQVLIEKRGERKKETKSRSNIKVYKEGKWIIFWITGLKRINSEILFLKIEFLKIFIEIFKIIYSWVDNDIFWWCIWNYVYLFCFEFLFWSSCFIVTLLNYHRNKCINNCAYYLHSCWKIFKVGNLNFYSNCQELFYGDQ